MSPQETIRRLAPFVTPERLERFRAVAARRTRQVTVVLENLYQDHNISAVLRTCDGLGVQDVHVIERENAFRVNEEVALGASKWLSIHRYMADAATPDPVAACLHRLRSLGYRLVATLPRHGALSVHNCPLDQPVALLLGTEMTGLSEEAIRGADVAVYYPMEGFTESFNVSVSAALFLQALLLRLDQLGQRHPLNTEEQDRLVAEWLTRSVRHAEAILR